MFVPLIFQNYTQACGAHLRPAQIHFQKAGLF